MEQCISFKWISGQIGDQHFPKAAIGIPFTIKGLTNQFFLQLDTGRPTCELTNLEVENFLDTKRLKHYEKIKISGFLDTIEIEHDFQIDKTTTTRAEGFSDENICIGFIGNDFLKARIVIIDFTKEKIYLSDNTNSIPSHTQFLEGEFSGNQFLTKLKIDNTIHSCIFDTGASIIDLMTTKEIWQEITGKNGNENDTIKFSVSAAYGTVLNLVGSIINKNIFWGTLNLKGKIVYYATNPSQYNDLSKSPYKCLIGNRLLYDTHTLILDYINKRIGISEVS